MTGKGKGDLLLQVTLRAGLTVFTKYELGSCIVVKKTLCKYLKTFGQLEL
jgi:hypothetical protein